MTATGRFNWYELMTSDTAAAGKFYETVIGWTTAPMGATGDGSPYTVFSTAEGGVAGMMTIPAEAAGMPPNWMGYIAVDNVDDYTRRFEAAGGVVHRPPIFPTSAASRWSPTRRAPWSTCSRRCPGTERFPAATVPVTPHGAS